MQSLILVDRQNNPIGAAERSEIHKSPGLLHRAFSIYIFRKNGTEFLMQRRHPSKLWGGIWANSCCSHPRAGEEIDEVAARRLKEELGFSFELTPVAGFVYQAEDPEGKGAEHEHVTVYRGDVDDDVTVTADPEEVAEWKWIGTDQLLSDMTAQPKLYAPWFHTGFRLLLDQ